MLLRHNVDIDAYILVHDLSETDKWELLGLVWEELEERGREEDWATFMDDYSITRKESK